MRCRRTYVLNNIGAPKMQKKFLGLLSFYFSNNEIINDIIQKILYTNNNPLKVCFLNKKHIITIQTPPTQFVVS